MDQPLQRYLNDHLAGSASAVHLIQEISAHLDRPEARAFFAALTATIDEERDILIRLVRSIDKQPSGILETVGKLAARLGELKFSWEGAGPGELGMFEALEMLTLGLQGKLLLWEVMEKIRPAFPEWGAEDFQTLIREARTQRNGVDSWRMQIGWECFVSGDRHKFLTSEDGARSQEATWHHASAVED